MSFGQRSVGHEEELYRLESLYNMKNVLSLFDGISCLQLALQRAGIKYVNYFASEINKNAIKVAQHWFPNTIQLGGIMDVHYKDGVLYTKDKEYKIGHIDLLAGGSCCRDFSSMNISYFHKYGLEGDKSSLFYEYLRLLKEVSPTYFLLENVGMKKSVKEKLDSYLGVSGIEINSRLVSYQNRPGIYWTNISGVEQPVDKHISFQDYKETDINVCRRYKCSKVPYLIRAWADGKGRRSTMFSCANVTHSDKVYSVLTKQGRIPNSGLVECDDFCRFLTRRELEQAQTLPVGYTSMLSYTQMQKVCGNAWTVDIISHILSYIPNK